MIEVVIAPLPLLQIVHLSLSLAHLDFVLFDSAHRLIPLLELCTVATLLVFALIDIGDACCVVASDF
jgi:hypothetical protein